MDGQTGGVTRQIHNISHVLLLTRLAGRWRSYSSTKELCWKKERGEMALLITMTSTALLVALCGGILTILVTLELMRSKRTEQKLRRQLEAASISPSETHILQQ